MPNTRETVRALISAFNVHNYFSNTVETNFTLQSRDGKDCIVVLFDKGMKDYQCSEYLYNIKRKIVGEFYGIEEGDTDEVVLNTANLIFNIESFPFDTSRGKWSQDEQGRIEFLAPIDKGVIFNLKSHLASSLKKDVIEDMPICHMVTEAFNKEKYLCHSKFPDKESRKQFECKFLSRMREKYENAPKNPLKVESNDVYIKDVFDDARFIDSVTRRAAWLIGRDLQADSKSRSDVKAFKDLMMEILDPSTRVIISAFLCASLLNREEASILIPVILSNRGAMFLTKEEAGDINHKFNNPVLDNISGKTQATLKTSGSSEVYGIDFSNPYISHCVITKIIESSVINKDHELSIDPELVRALSPAQSPVEMPNGYLNEARSESPMCSRGALKDSPRQGLVGKIPEFLVLRENPLGAPGTSSFSRLQSRSSSSKGAQAGQATCSVPSPAFSLTTRNDPKSSNPEFSACSPGEPLAPLASDESDRESSDECSEAKLQKSESSKKHSGSVQKIKKLLSSPFKKQDVNLKRHDVGRDTTRSTPETPVTEKSSVSKSFFSLPTRKKAKSNPPSGVTSPVHSSSNTELSPQGATSKRQQRLDHAVNAQSLLSNNPGSKKSNRDSGFVSMGNPSPAVGRVPSELKECDTQRAKHMSEALEK